MYYGIPLFIAGILVGGYCGWVIAEKVVSPFLMIEGIISLGSPLETLPGGT
jgi:F0F1-type ATP synthase assembly protein I